VQQPNPAKWTLGPIDLSFFQNVSQSFMRFHDRHIFVRAVSQLVVVLSIIAGGLAACYGLIAMMFGVANLVMKMLSIGDATSPYWAYALFGIGGLAFAYACCAFVVFVGQAVTQRTLQVLISGFCIPGGLLLAYAGFGMAQVLDLLHLNFWHMFGYVDAVGVFFGWALGLGGLCMVVLGALVAFMSPAEFVEYRARQATV